MATLDAFTGWDTRPGDLPPGALRVADDVYLDARGSCVRRPGLVLRAHLPAGTAGLYVHDDTLRAVAPEGTDTTGLYPTILLDYLPISSCAGRVEAGRLASGRRILWIESVNGDVGKLAITTKDYATAGGVVLSPGFFPVGLVFIDGRAWSLDPETNRLRWSGLDDPDSNDGKGYLESWDPVATGPAKGGYISTSKGGSEPRHVCEYRGQVAVFLRTSVMLVSMSDTGADGINESITGPGTRHPGLVRSVSGDLIYFDPGARFRRLPTDLVSTQPQENTIGEEVATAAGDLFPPGYSITQPVSSCYARGLGLYLGAYGTTILAGSMQPGSQQVKWSKWNLPAAIGPITAMEECRGTVYVRTASKVWSFELIAPDDEVEANTHVPIQPVVEPYPMAGGARSAEWDTMAVQAFGQVVLQVVHDGSPGAPATLTGATPRPVRRVGSWRGRSLSMRMSSPAAPAGWRIDGCSGSGGN